MPPLDDLRSVSLSPTANLAGQSLSALAAYTKEDDYAVGSVKSANVLSGEGFLKAESSRFQHTLAGSVQCSGVGVHSGEQVRLRLCPAPADTGIVFIRTDLGQSNRTIPALWHNVVDTQLCTVIGNHAGARVATIEHLMAALRAAEIDNAYIEIDGAEVPVMDGSSDPFIFMIEMAGTDIQTSPKKEILIKKTVSIGSEAKSATLRPADMARYSFDIAFNREPIQDQSFDLLLSQTSFKNQISRARTFGFFEEVDHLRKLGFARGGSLQNAIVVKDNQIMNEEGLRYGNEFVRHKLLDSIGDLALAGASIRGHFHGNCSGHALNNQLLHTLFADPSAYEIITR